MCLYHIPEIRAPPTWDPTLVRPPMSPVEGNEYVFVDVNLCPERFIQPTRMELHDRPVEGIPSESRISTV